MESKPQRKSTNTNELIRYASLGTQILVALGLAVFLGLKADKWMKISAPLLVWLLPLLVLVGIMYQVFKATSKRKDKHGEK